jgi:hypothetical protein
MPTIKQKVENVFQNRIGEKFIREEIIDMVVNAYPGTPRGNVIPSDYCYNRINKDNAKKFDFHFFEWLDDAQYLCLGPNHQYTGTIYWRPKHWKKDKAVGEWKEGSYKLWEDPR